MITSEQWDVILEDAVIEKKSIGQVVREHGVAHGAVRSALRRRGLTGALPSEVGKRIRHEDIIEDMTQSEAIEYLLDIVKYHVPEEYVEDECPVDVGSGAKKRILTILYRHQGKMVTKQHLHDALYWDRAADDVPQIKIIGVQICNLREKLVDTEYSLETVWGEGYRLVRDG